LPDPLRIVQVNAAYDPALPDAQSLLDRYLTLTGWAQAVWRAGASVSVVQRFRSGGVVRRNGVDYTFVSGDGAAFPPPEWTSATVVAAVAASRPDLVHVNGLMFPALVSGLRQSLGARAVIVAQDHGSFGPPLAARSPLPSASRRLWRDGFDAMDACSFTAEEQAEAWRDAGCLRRTRVLSVIEAGADVAPQPREAARRSTGLNGSPGIIWVGRLDANKDPMTVLDGLEQAMERLPDARAWMIYRSATLEAAVTRRIERSRALATRVTLVGAVPHDQVVSYLSAADVYVSGSHREGSGYALIEAMACGCWPVVTDIPPYRAIVGDSGARWPRGDSRRCAGLLIEAAQADLPARREEVLLRFARELTWRAIAARTMALYGELVADRTGGTSA
jgi:glycosyltransferase involved in cell wall biosynthesis